MKSYSCSLERKNLLLFYILLKLNLFVVVKNVKKLVKIPQILHNLNEIEIFVSSICDIDIIFR